MPRFAIYGAGGFGREGLPLVGGGTGSGLESDVVFVDDSGAGGPLNGHPVITFDELCRAEHRDRLVALAVAAGRLRRDLAARCREAGVAFARITAASATVDPTSELGEGAIVCAHALISCNTRIGAHFHCNFYSYVAHDCVVGDFVTFAPRVSCSGNVVIEDDVYVGTGAVIIEGTPDKPLVIGRGAVIGMGALVMRDVPPGSTVLGAPGRAMRLAPE